MNIVPGAGRALSLPVEEHELGQARLGVLHPDEGVHDLVGVEVLLHLVHAVLALQDESLSLCIQGDNSER